LDDLGRDAVFFGPHGLDARVLNFAELRQGLQVLSTGLGHPPETPFRFAVTTAVVHPAGTSVAQGGVAAALDAALQPSYGFPVLGGVDARVLPVVGLVVDHREALRHAWVDAAGLEPGWLRRVVRKLVHQRGGETSAMFGDANGAGLLDDVDAVVGSEPQDGQALDVDLGNARVTELYVLYCRLGDFEGAEGVWRACSREASVWDREGAVVGVVDALGDGLNDATGDVAEVRVVCPQVGDAGVLMPEDLVGRHAHSGQLLAVSDGGVLELAE